MVEETSCFPIEISVFGSGINVVGVLCFGL